MKVYSKILKKPEKKKNYFNSSIWISKESKIAKNKLKLKEENIRLDNVLFYYLFFSKIKKINILDWGGGFGNLYFDLLNIKKKITILVYEPEKKIVDYAKKIFKKIKNISFTYNKLDIFKKKIDLLYLGSVLQYIHNFEKFLIDLKKINPKEIVIFDMLSSQNPNFYSYQNFFGEQMLVKFYNFNYVVKKLKNLGYKVIFKSKIQRKILNKFQSPPMNHFPKKYRIDYAKQIILRKV